MAHFLSGKNKTLDLEDQDCRVLYVSLLYHSTTACHFLLYNPIILVKQDILPHAANLAIGLIKSKNSYFLLPSTWCCPARQRYGIYFDVANYDDR